MRFIFGSELCFLSHWKPLVDQSFLRPLLAVAVSQSRSRLSRQGGVVDHPHTAD